MAQVAGSVSVQSDYVVRGYSISADKPAAILNLSYDDPSGVYANGSAIGDLDGNGSPAFQGLIGDIGYARRLTSRVSVDVGLMRTQYYQFYGAKSDVGYTEGYAGVIAHGLAARVYYSPDYYRPGVQAVYGELEGSREVWAKIHLGVHVGYLDYLSRPADAAGPAARRNQYDWRLSASRLFAPVDLPLAVTGGGPGSDYYLSERHDKTAVTVGLSWAF